MVETPARATAAGRISELFLYPIKGCRGVSVPELAIEPGGPRHDRRYMVVDEQGQFLTQRTHPQLATVDCHLRDDGRIEVSSHDRAAVIVSPPPPELPEQRCRIWSDEVRVRAAIAGSEWFSSFLGQRVELVHVAPEALRHVNPERAAPGDLVGLADGYPLLWTNQASLEELNQRLEGPIPMTRFRPNVVTTGLRAFEEDVARRVLIGPGKFWMPKLCDRCVVTGTDQVSGARSKEPLRTLAGFRKWGGAVWFGANLLPDQAEARAGFSIRVGDAVEILETQEHPRGE